jgi:DNA-binding CsgD family transcriptional regulator
MNLPKKFREYLKLTSTDEMNSIIHPLQKLSLNYFLYVRESAEGERIFLTNRSDWNEYFYENEYYKISPFENPVEKKFPGIYLWRILRGQEVFKVAREQFNIAHGITIIQKKDENTEFYHFATGQKNEKIHSVYEQSLNGILHFIQYFKNEAAGLIRLAEDNKVEVPKPDAATSKRLTQKEIVCLKWLVKGKTAEEIGIILNISKRTVEAHIENVKNKFHCYKQVELGYKLGKEGFL